MLEPVKRLPKYKMLLSGEDCLADQFVSNLNMGSFLGMESTSEIDLYSGVGIVLGPNIF